MGSTTYANVRDEDQSIGREADVTYIHLNRQHEGDSWGYCIDGTGVIWYDSLEELEEDYDTTDVVYYYNDQLED